jgi:hypothetical protein
MAEKYERQIISTKEHYTRLHRTSRNKVQSILKRGLLVGPGPINSTTTPQSEDSKTAKTLYENGRAYGDAAVVIHIPRKVWDASYAKSKDNPGMTEDIVYSVPKQGYAIRPEFIAGWIDRNTNQFHPNVNSGKISPKKKKTK